MYLLKSNLIGFITFILIIVELTIGFGTLALVNVPRAERVGNIGINLQLGEDLFEVKLINGLLVSKRIEQATMNTTVTCDNLQFFQLIANSDTKTNIETSQIEINSR